MNKGFNIQSSGLYRWSIIIKENWFEIKQIKKKKNKRNELIQKVIRNKQEGVIKIK